jgi:S1-C subfamily serine protease
MSIEPSVCATSIFRAAISTVCLLALTISSAVAQVTTTATGSGVVVGAHGEILTNFHVVESCENITVKLPLKNVETATLIARDQKNDLAVVQIKTLPASVATFRGGTSLRAGDTIVAMGYPLSGLLASAANLSTGIVSALAGLGDDTRYLQISAPVQPGNSGGPLLDTSGHLVGIVTSKLNAVRIARFTGDVPQNVNFAIKGEIARAFLDSMGINYQMAQSSQSLSVAEVGDVARPFTVFVECKQAAPRTAAAVKHPPNQPPPPTQKPGVATTRIKPEQIVGRWGLAAYHKEPQKPLAIVGSARSMPSALLYRCWSFWWHHDASRRRSGAQRAKYKIRERTENIYRSARRCRR